jgi:hypothetical protein
VPTEAERRADSEKFVHQTTVDAIVEAALNAVDKPEIFNAEPERGLSNSLERYPAAFEEALARCRKLAEDNPRDFVAAGAVQILTHVLDATA